jgi:hypothetical protein
VGSDLIYYKLNWSSVVLVVLIEASSARTDRSKKTVKIIAICASRYTATSGECIAIICRPNRIEKVL